MGPICFGTRITTIHDHFVAMSEKKEMHGITTQEDFQEVLQALVREAHVNNVNIRGSWPVLQENDETRGWEIVVSALLLSR